MEVFLYTISNVIIFTYEIRKLFYNESFVAVLTNHQNERYSFRWDFPHISTSRVKEFNL